MTNGAPLPQSSAKGDSPTASPTTSPIAGILSDPEDDLTLRVALYGVMFQAYVDQVTKQTLGRTSRDHNLNIVALVTLVSMNDVSILVYKSIIEVLLWTHSCKLITYSIIY